MKPAYDSKNTETPSVRRATSWDGGWWKCKYLLFVFVTIVSVLTSAFGSTREIRAGLEAKCVIGRCRQAETYLDKAQETQKHQGLWHGLSRYAGVFSGITECMLPYDSIDAISTSPSSLALSRAIPHFPLLPHNHNDVPSPPLLAANVQSWPT